MRVLHLARKPLASTVAESVLKHGTGGINIDQARITPSHDYGRKATNAKGVIADRSLGNLFPRAEREGDYASKLGRWPSNLILLHSPDCLPSSCSSTCSVHTLDAQGGHSVTGVRSAKSKSRDVPGTSWLPANHASQEYQDSGGASRFFKVFYSEKH